MEMTVRRPRGQFSRVATSPLVVTLSLLILGFLAAPWSIERKAHMALHGLCAQRPSHSYWVGGARLPFDARMMGIYTGFIVGAAVLLAVGGYRRSGAVSLGWGLALALLVGAMALDGLNSLLLDMLQWHPYPPSNSLRVLTGAGAGIALAIALCHVASITLWRTTDRSRFVVVGWRQVAMLAVAPAPMLLLVTSAPRWLFGPVAVVLILGALSVLATLALICIVLIRRLDYAFTSPSQLEPVAVQAILVAVAVMASLSASRFVIERLFGTTPLT